MMYVLVDTFNGRTVSRHRSYAAAERAGDVLARRVRQANGAGSYLPTRIAAETAPSDPAGRHGEGVCLGPNTYYGAGRLCCDCAEGICEHAEGGAA